MENANGYEEFLRRKRIKAKTSGIEVAPDSVHPLLYPFQRDLTLWALRKGRAAVFADTGLGKTFMQLEWARLLRERALIVAPLSVARQTVREAEKIDVRVVYVRDKKAVEDSAGELFITNYEMVAKFDPAEFGAVVLDESSILKALAGKTRRKLTDMFRKTRYKLCCTATPAPNDIAEIANHSEFLGVMARTDMLAAFFVHDDKGWRLRGHAEEAFYRWLSSWGMSVRKPSDLGPRYDDNDFILPPLRIEPVVVETGYVPEGQLFFTGLGGIRGRHAIRRETLPERTAAAAELINGADEQWLVWCGLNDESSRLVEAVPGAAEVRGNHKLEKKVATIQRFQDGELRVLVTKPKIAGFGMNFQQCHNMVFLGLNDSWESYYQAIRRCYRFGQKSPVNVYIVVSDVEREIYRNILRKEEQASIMAQKLIENVQQFEREEIVNLDSTNGWDYETRTVEGDGWTLMLGDAVERLTEIPDESVHLSVFSPPFMDLYTYSPTERDLGNSIKEKDFFAHFGYVIKQLLRVTHPGRNCAVHTSDIPALLSKDGYIGLKDFPGKVILAFEKEGWIFYGRVVIDKNPQAQAIRTHSKALLFTQMEKDSSWSRPAMGDQVLVFRKPGDNPTPVKPVENGELDRNTWIEWAHPIWWGIRETDTLQYTTAREENDDKHICPLQLGTIERCIVLWSNPGETVLDPFVGIGSVVHQAIKMGREGVGIELKRGYFDVAVRNARDAVEETAAVTLFDII